MYSLVCYMYFGAYFSRCSAIHEKKRKYCQSIYNSLFIHIYLDFKENKSMSKTWLNNYFHSLETDTLTCHVLPIRTMGNVLHDYGCTKYVGKQSPVDYYSNMQQSGDPFCCIPLSRWEYATPVYGPYLSIVASPQTAVIPLIGTATWEQTSSFWVWSKISMKRRSIKHNR